MLYEQAKQLILENCPDDNIVAAFSFVYGYIFSLMPKTWSDEDGPLDHMYKVALDGTITEYSPVMNPEEFKKALKNRIE